MKVYKNGTETTGTEIVVNDEDIFKYTGKGQNELFEVKAGETKYFIDINGGEKTQINIISTPTDEISIDLIKAVSVKDGEKIFFTSDAQNSKNGDNNSFVNQDIYTPPDFLIFGFSITNNSNNDILIKPLTTSIGIKNN